MCKVINSPICMVIQMSMHNVLIEPVKFLFKISFSFSLGVSVTHIMTILRIFKKSKNIIEEKQNFIQWCHELFIKRPFMHIIIQVQSQSVATFRYSSIQFLLKLHTQIHKRVCIRPIPTNVLEFFAFKSRAISFSIYILITRYGDSEVSELETTFNH